jgi:hypothetical protein
VRERSDTDPKFPDALPTEAKALAAMRDEVDDDLDFRELLEAQLGELKEWVRGDRKYRRRLYAKLQAVYAIYVLASGHLKREALVQRRCKSAGITETQASHLSIRLVKLLFRPTEKTTYQYAAALRYAVFKKIAVDDLAAVLEKKGGGIAKFADRFWQKASKLSSDAAVDTEDNGDALEDASDSGKHRSSKRREYDQSAEAIPEFKWNDKALKLYAEAPSGAQIRQIAEKGSDGRWIVIKVRVVA